MQQIFLTNACPKEYFRLNQQFDIPRPGHCLNPSCLTPRPPKKHGFYTRNVVDLDFDNKISIRRFYCPYCGKTFSYLPSFCLPYFQYTLDLIYLGILSHLFKLTSFMISLFALKKPNLKRQNIEYHGKRFISNIQKTQLGIRFLRPQIELPDFKDRKRGAQKLTCIISAEFTEIQTFSSRFFRACNQSFMSPCKIF